MIRGGMVEVPVARVSVAIRYYVETLGVKLVDDRGESCAVLDLGQGALVALVEKPRDSARACIGLSVADVPRAVSLLENRGIVFRSEAHAGRATSAFSDPEGNTLYLFQG